MTGSDSWRAAWRGAIGLALVGLLGAGCSPGEKRLTVTGTVTLDGKPFEHGRIQLYGANNQFSTAEIASDGTFIVTDVVPGELRVAVVTPGGLVTLAPPEDKGAPPVAPIKARAVPTKYQSADTSGLVFNITPTSTNVQISMSSK